MMDSTIVALMMVLLAGRGLESVQGRHIPKVIEDNIEKLEDPLNLKDTALVPGPVFTSLLKKITNSTFQKHEQMVLLNATLNVYEKIFSEMLNGPNKAQTEPSLEILRKKVMDLQKHVLLRRDLTALLQTLASIKVDDNVVQRKAINELKEVYYTVSEIGRHAS